MLYIERMTRPVTTNVVPPENGTACGLLKSRPRSALWGLWGDFTFVPVALARCSEAEVAMTNSALLLARRANTSVAGVVRPRSDVAQTPEPRRGDTYADDSSLHAPRWGSIGIRRTISGASRHRLGLLRPSGPTASTDSLATWGRNTNGINTCNLNLQFISRQAGRNPERLLPRPNHLPFQLRRRLRPEAVCVWT